MIEGKWLEKYSGQSTQDLISLEGEYRIPSLILAFEQAIAHKSLHEPLSEEEHIILAVEALEREVNNGGYSQFFRNTPQFASTIVPSLLRIGCPRTAEITLRAIDALKLPDLTVEAIRAAIATETKEHIANLRQFDDLYYNETEAIAVPLFTFIKVKRDTIKI